jgi:hypothetical protein
MNKIKLKAVISGAEGSETVYGTRAGETTTHYLLSKEADRTGAGVLEWFAKKSRRVTCEVVG